MLSPQHSRPAEDEGSAPPHCTIRPPIVRAVRAIQFVREMSGASRPCLLRADCGGYYVVKFQNNPQHVRVLANELFATRLALLIGLPVNQPAIVEVPPQLIADKLRGEMEMGGRRVRYGPGLHYGSRYAGTRGQTLIVDFLPDTLLRRVWNLGPTFAGAFVFDKWTCNCDGRQMIFARPASAEGCPYSARLIDQGSCFNEGEWTFPDSPIRNIYPRRLVYESVGGLSSFEPFLSCIENLEAHQIEDCTEGIPSEWYGAESAKLARLAKRLFERRTWLRQAIMDAKNCDLLPFPNWR